MPKKCKSCGENLRDWEEANFKLCLYCHIFPKDPLYHVRKLFREISEDAEEVQDAEEM